MTELGIETSVRGGTDLAKLFPTRVRGPAYLRDLMGPMPELRLIPTGGVDSTMQTLRAGAVAGVVGAASINEDSVPQPSALTAAAARFLSNVVPKQEPERSHRDGC
jgi:2-dehydro-3-deoxyphosphogluconate aldolase / (4S)-4-hydroxy-2-oxoglutarate aldolase